MTKAIQTSSPAMARIIVFACMMLKVGSKLIIAW